MTARGDSIAAFSLELSSSLLSADWSGWLAAIGDMLSAHKVAVFVPPGHRLRPFATGRIGFSDADVASYEAYYGTIDVFAARMATKPAHHAYVLEDLVPRHALDRTEIYQDFCRPSGMTHVLGVPLDIDGTDRFLFECMRDESQVGFSPRDVELFGRISEHVLRFLQAWRVLDEARTARRSFNWLADLVAVPTFLLTRDMRVVFANARGEEHLRSGEYVLRRATGTISASGGTEPLAAAAAHIASGGAATRLVRLRSARSGEQTLAVLTRLPESEAESAAPGGSLPAMALILIDRQPGAPPAPAHLAAALDLTPREAETASLLMAGLTIDDVAARLRVSREAVRHHVKGLFLKTQTHNQRDLVQAIHAALGPVGSLLDPPLDA
ncbi:MAG: helix-turn-helix transcriptional regulator [Bauldia sp.]|nr:helix-turn-helix transcriptional regulator [Bauldia sp.]